MSEFGGSHNRPRGRWRNRTAAASLPQMGDVVGQFQCRQIALTATQGHAVYPQDVTVALYAGGHDRMFCIGANQRGGGREQTARSTAAGCVQDDSVLQNQRVRLVQIGQPPVVGPYCRDIGIDRSEAVTA